MFMNSIPNVVMRNMTASIVTILPAYIIAVVVPNAFIIILGFCWYDSCNYCNFITGLSII